MFYFTIVTILSFCCRKNLRRNRLKVCPFCYFVRDGFSFKSHACWDVRIPNRNTTLLISRIVYVHGLFTFVWWTWYKADVMTNVSDNIGDNVARILTLTCCHATVRTGSFLFYYFLFFVGVDIRLGPTFASIHHLVVHFFPHSSASPRSALTLAHHLLFGLTRLLFSWLLCIAILST